MSIRNKIVSFICCFLMVWTPVAVQAEEARINPESVSPGVVTELRKGQHAPYAGILFSRDAAAKLYTQLKFSEEDCKLRIDKRLKITNLDFSTQIKLLELRLKTEQDRSTKLLAVKNDRIQFLEKNLNPPAWYESGEFWFAMGVVGGILITVASGYALSQANK